MEYTNDELAASVAKLKNELQYSIYRLMDMLKGDDGQAWDEAEKALPRLQKALVESPSVTLDHLILTKQAEAVKGLPLKGCDDLDDALSLQESSTRVYRRQANEVKNGQG